MMTVVLYIFGLLVFCVLLILVLCAPMLLAAHWHEKTRDRGGICKCGCGIRHR